MSVEPHVRVRVTLHDAFRICAEHFGMTSARAVYTPLTPVAGETAIFEIRCPVTACDMVKLSQLKEQKD